MERPSKAAKAAKAKGLKYASFGRWKDPSTNKVVAKTDGEGATAVLIPVKSDDMKGGGKVTPSQKAKKKAKASQKDTPEIPDKPKKEKPVKKDEPTTDEPTTDEPTTDEPTDDPTVDKEFNDKYVKGKYDSAEEREAERKAIQKVSDKYPGGEIRPDSEDANLYPDGENDPEYKKDKAAYEAQYNVGPKSKFKTWEERDDALGNATRGADKKNPNPPPAKLPGKAFTHQPPVDNKDLFPNGADDPQFKEEQESWEKKQKPGSTWVRHDGTAVGTNPKTGDRQGFKVDDDHPNGAYMAAAYAEGKPISSEEAQRRADTDKQKAVDDFENWKAGLEGDEEKDKSHMGGNFINNLFGVKVPSLKDLFTGN